MGINDKIKAVRHVGYFVDDIDKSLAMFKRLFDVGDEDIRVMSAEETAGTGVFGFVNVGGMELELIELKSDDVKAMCGNPPPGISHVAFEVEDIETVIAEMEKKGFRLGYITRHGIFDNGRSKVAYLEPADTDGHLIELVEPRR